MKTAEPPHPPQTRECGSQRPFIGDESKPPLQRLRRLGALPAASSKPLEKSLSALRCGIPCAASAVRRRKVDSTAIALIRSGWGLHCSRRAAGGARDSRKRAGLQRPTPLHQNHGLSGAAASNPRQSAKRRLRLITPFFYNARPPKRGLFLRRPPSAARSAVYRG